MLSLVSRTMRKFPNEFEVTKLQKFPSANPIEIVRSKQLCDHPEHVMLRVHAQ